MSGDNKHHLDYEQTAAYFREVHETRFRLLALLPVATGAAIALLPKDISGPQEIALGGLGLLVTLGLTIYDQRNSQIYDRLIRRAKLLEVYLRLCPLQLAAGSTARKVGGAFTDRPPRRYIWKVPFIWHDLGLSFVYASSLGGWTFILAEGVMKRRHGLDLSAADEPFMLWVSLGCTVLFFFALIALACFNDLENKPIDAWIEEELAKISAPGGGTTVSTG